MTTKTETKQFQYEIQSYQEDCVTNITSLFESLHQKVNFGEVLTAHHNKNKYKFPVQDTKNIDIMMETGTGKTFTFIKTIFELSKNFGYKKFIVLIPTVPIREGTKTNLEDTKDYFKSFYANEKEKEIETFVYEGGNISAVKQFIGTSHLSVLVMTPSSFRHKDNILNRPLEREIYAPNLFENNTEPPKTYLECLKRLNPIVIMDEPHRFEGNAFKTYFEGFENYFLRFGATFPKKKDSLPLSNVAYVLDSISSFRQSLVKKIVVYTQDVVENTDTLVGIEKVGTVNKALVSTLTNGIIARRELGVGAVFNGKSIKKINKDTIVLADDTIEKVDYSLSDESLRAMIKETIKIHFEKEKTLFEQGIKALTLFFMESDTSLFRGSNPKIKNFFEEEYKKQYAEIVSKLDQESDYYKFLQNDFDSDNTLQVHKGYFSGDKGNADEKVKAGVDEILKAKIILLVFGIVISVDCFSQYHDAMSNFQRILEFTEKKQWEINAALDRVEQIETLREQLVALQETKKNVELSYQMAKRAEDDMKVLGSVADGGIHSLANAFEVILGQSINPADYIPKVPGTQNLRNAFEYDAASYLSDNTRSAHKELFTFNADDETNEDGISLTKNLRAFGESSAAVFGMSQAWEKYAEEVKARNILKKKAQAEELRTQAKALQVEIETPELMNLTAADRMNFMNLVTEMYDKANRLDMEVVEEVKAEIEKQLPSNYELVLLIEEGVSIKLQNTLKQVVKPYVSNQKFSLSKYEKSYSRGKINQELQRGLEGL